MRNINRSVTYTPRLISMFKMDNWVALSILFVIQATTICIAQDGSLNPALGKMATQSGMYYGRDANRAVDGYLYSQSDNTHCADIDTSDHSYTGNKQFAWWQVDLADIYTITSVTIYNTGNEQEWRFQYNFIVYVSYGSDVSDAANRRVCRWLWPNITAADGVVDVVRVPRNDSYTVNCTSAVVGQYVTIKRTGGDSPTRMTLCEVEVDGTRYYQCQNCQGSCNHNTGCNSCNPGFKPPTCTSVCEPGRFGVNCVNQCPPCPETNLPCDKVTGQCPCPEGRYCRTETNGSSTTMHGFDNIVDAVTKDGLFQGNVSSPGSASGVEQFRGTGTTVLGALVLFAVTRMSKRRD